MDEEIARAYRIGQANARVIELAQNWCAHLQVEKNGGTGIIEAQTGLPIGMRSFRCVHASAAGFAGMALNTIALDFYDRNCVGCTKRVPVRFPNLSQLAAEREDAAKAQHEHHESELRKEKARYEERRRHRETLSQAADEATRALFENIDSLDLEPTKQKVDVLVELTTIAPERFDAAVQEALFQLANESDSYLVLDGTLTILRNIHADPKALCRTALHVLSHSAIAVAGTIVQENVTPEHTSQIAPAIPMLISLAGPHDNWLPLPVLKDDSTGLLAAYRAAPEAVSGVIEQMLGSPDKLIRIGAAHAIQQIRRIDDRFGLKLIEPLVYSAELPDDHYGRGSSESWVQDLLAEMLETHFEEVDPLLTAAFAKLRGHDRDVGLGQVYLRLFRSLRHGRREDPTDVTRAHEVLFGRLLHYLSTKCVEQESLQLLEFFRHDAQRYPQLVEAHIDGLLGAIAILAEEQVNASTSFLQLELPPNPLAALEASHRKHTLHYLVDAVAQLVGNTAKQRPATVGKSLLDTMTQLEGAHDELRAELIKALGLMAQNRETLPSILPSLYGSMTGSSQRVRAAAASAYGEVISRDPDDLPPLLHETFITLLTDPFVIVHWSALEVLERHWLPEVYDNVLRWHVFHIIAAHSGSERDHDVLKVAIDVFLDFQRGKDAEMSSRLRETMLEKIELCRDHDRAELLRRHAFQLRQSSRFVKAVLNVLNNEEASEYTVEKLLKVLGEVPAPEIRACADDFVSAMEACAANGRFVTDAAIEILTGAHLWNHAMRLAETEERRWGDSQWDRQRKLHSQLRVFSCAIEHYSSQGDISGLREAISAYRQKEAEFSQDEEENKRRRDPLFGIGNQSQST
jgi:hypothetical protein